MAAGTPFSAAHTFAQTGPFRPGNLPRGVENVVLAGCGTTPGRRGPDRGRVRQARRAAHRRGRRMTSVAAPPRAAAGELDAAGITAPALRGAYARCRALNAAHGRTYFLATRLLTPAQRPAIHALYGFARMADDVVDAPGAAGPGRGGGAPGGGPGPDAGGARRRGGPGEPAATASRWSRRSPTPSTATGSSTATSRTSWTRWRWTSRSPATGPSTTSASTCTAPPR